MTFLPRDGLLSSETTASVPAHIPIYHNQLRDLLVCPQERGLVAYISGRLIVSHDIRGSYQSPKLLAPLDFEPNCLSSGAGLVVAGGGNGELYIGALADSSQSSFVASSTPSFSSPHIQWSHTTKLSTASINNSLLITRNDLTPSGPLPDLTNGYPRLFVSNNDESIKVFNISVSGATQGRMVPAGSIRVGTPVNHTSISPDGKTLLAVGDTNEVFLYNLAAGDSVEFNRISKYRAGSDANFSTAWSSDGRKFAVACQDGSVTVWDTRSSKTLALFRSGKQHPDYHSLTGGGRGHFINTYYPTRATATSGYTARLMTRPASAAIGGITTSPGARLEGSIVARYLAERSPYSASYNDLLNRTESERRSTPNLESIVARNRNRWEGSERSPVVPPAPDPAERRSDGEPWANASTGRDREPVPSGTISAAGLQDRPSQNSNEPNPNTTLPYYPSSQFYPSPPDRELLPLPPRDIVLSWPDHHRTSITYGDPGRGLGSWMEQRVEGPVSAPGLSIEERNPARVLKFSPASGSRDVLVFTEDSTRFHVVDAQSFDNHLVVSVPKATSGSDLPTSSRRNLNQLWPSSSNTRQYEFDEDTENSEEMSMSGPAHQLSASPSWPSRGPALSVLPDGTPNLAGLAFDPTGGWLYVGSDTGIFEWELDYESRKWDRGYIRMPSEQATWLISVPDDSDAIGLPQSLVTKLVQARAVPRENAASLEIPSLKTGTLDLLITLSEELPKHDHSFTQITAKIVETLRNLLSNDSTRLSQHTLVDERTVDEYILGSWKWNTGKYPINRGLRELVDGLVKEMNAIDTVMKAKLNAYNLAKGSLVQMQRKKTGNLAVRSLAEVVSKDDFIPDSEYMESLMVAVPKNSVKDWESKYERLASMVVPRSSKKVAEDDDYALFSVVVFKKVHDEFAQKLRENKFILRDFTYSPTAIQRANEEFSIAETTERELWTELLRISRTNFSEAFQVLVHLKVVRLFVESVLRYGLPAQFVGIVVKPDVKSPKKALQVLTEHFKYLANRSNSSKTKTAPSAGGSEELAAEYQSLMEQEFLDFVVFEVPWIV